MNKRKAFDDIEAEGIQTIRIISLFAQAENSPYSEKLI